MTAVLARDAMDDGMLVVEPDLAVDELARRLDEAGQPGAVVVADDEVVGVVTEMDLVFRNKRIHLPSMIAIFDAVIPFDPGGRARAELAKATGAAVRELMTRDIVSAKSDTPLFAVSDWMVDQGLSVVPIIDDGKLKGVVTRRSAMRAAFRNRD